MTLEAMTMGTVYLSIYLRGRVYAVAQNETMRSHQSRNALLIRRMYDVLNVKEVPICRRRCAHPTKRIEMPATPEVPSLEGSSRDLLKVGNIDWLTTVFSTPVSISPGRPSSSCINFYLADVQGRRRRRRGPGSSP